MGCRSPAARQRVILRIDPPGLRPLLWAAARDRTSGGIWRRELERIGHAESFAVRRAQSREVIKKPSGTAVAAGTPASPSTVSSAVFLQMSDGPSLPLAPPPSFPLSDLTNTIVFSCRTVISRRRYMPHQILIPPCETHDRRRAFRLFLTSLSLFLFALSSLTSTPSTLVSALPQLLTHPSPF